jgi:hypothetical protein
MIEASTPAAMPWSVPPKPGHPRPDRNDQLVEHADGRNSPAFLHR